MEDYLLLVPNKIKNSIIKKVREEHYHDNIKFMSLEEFIKKCTFDTDKKTLYYLMKEYHLKYSIAYLYLQNLPYISNKLDNSKMHLLKEIKSYLEHKNLLIYNDYFKKSMQKKKIFIYGYNYLTKYQKYILKDFNYELINSKKKYPLLKIYHAENIDDEVIFVANKITELLKDKININHIKIIISDEYKSIIERIFTIFNLPLRINKNNLYSSYTCKKVLNNLDRLDDVLEEIKNSPLYDDIINILNNYSFIDTKNEVSDLITIDFQNARFPTNTNNCLKICKLDDYFEDDDYVFLMGYNKENLPLIYKDDDYFSDTEKQILGLDTSISLNSYEKEKTISLISHIKNLIVTTKSFANNKAYTISDLIDNITIEEITNNDYTNSHLMNKIMLAEKLDDLVKFNIKSPDLAILYNNYPNIPFMKYDNKYTKIQEEKLFSYLKNKLLLSYTALDNYNRCGFKYYLNHILGLSVIQDDFSRLIGDTCHYVLSQMNRKDFNFDKCFNDYLIKARSLTSREKFLLENIKEELLFVIDTIHHQMTYTNFNQTLCEEKVYVNLDKKIKVTFMGVIDKILYKEEEGISYIVVIDYKTGNANIKLNNLRYGIDIQLPVYLYLSSNLKLHNIEIVGFYLQKILNNVSDSKKDYQEEKENALRLEGYSSDNQNILSMFDKTYQQSKLIKGIRVTKDGNFYKQSKVLAKEEISHLINQVQKIIDSCTDHILDADFSINPKVINGENVSCINCHYQDICYHKPSDFIYLNEEKESEDEE